MLKQACVLAVALAAVATACKASEYRLWLAAQIDEDAKRGFRLSLQSGASSQPATFRNARVVLEVGDGKAWTLLEHAPRWELNRNTAVRAVIAPAETRLFVNGRLVASHKVRFVPAPGSVSAGLIPFWAAGPLDAFAVESTLGLASSRGAHAALRWPQRDAGPAALRLFDPQMPKRVPWNSIAGQTLTIAATVRFTPAPEPRALAPFVDRYGQPIAAQYPGKAATDADLAAAITDETRHTRKWKAPSHRDRFGGDTSAGWSTRPTGYYRVTRHSGMWWLVSPEGHPLFYTGLCTVDRAAWERTPVTGREFLFAELPPRKGPFAQAWAVSPWSTDDPVDYVSFYTANLVRKYGPHWFEKTEGLIQRRLRQWGFCGAGKWSDGHIPQMPNIAVIYHGDVPNVAEHPDVFDPSIRSVLRNALRREVHPRRNDRWLIGWSVGNEYPEVIHRSEIPTILAKPAGTPAKQALIDFAVEHLYKGNISAAARAWGIPASTRSDLYVSIPKPPSDDVEAMRRFYADRYYAFLHRTVKELDPNHLYMGCWMVPGWWENEADWALIAAHCDVIGYDWYADTFADDRMLRRMAATDKPVFCGEFGFPPFYDGMRGFGAYTAVNASDDRDAGRRYAAWIKAAAGNPWCVGVCLFQYRDQPVTGRGPGSGDALVIGEHFAFGVVDVTDRPKWGIVDAVRAANLLAPAIRRAASRHRR